MWHAPHSARHVALSCGAFQTSSRAYATAQSESRQIVQRSASEYPVIWDMPPSMAHPATEAAYFAGAANCDM